MPDFVERRRRHRRHYQPTDWRVNTVKLIIHIISRAKQHGKIRLELERKSKGYTRI